VVAAGGDGTIRQIAAELIGSPVPLAIAPGGTGNVLANEIGLARTPDAVADMVLRGPVLPVPVARANGEPFLLMAGAGLDARVLQRLDPALKGRIGKAAYCPATVGALMHPLDTLRVRIGAAMHEATWAIVANARHYGGAFVLTRSTTIAQQGLVAVLFKSTSRARLLAQLASLALGRLDVRAVRGGDVEIVRCTDVVIEADRAVPTQLDGDVFGVTPLHVQTSDDIVHLVVPRDCPLR
jgi:diacylglycerol kinase (ATP)